MSDKISDSEIIELYFERSESAISNTDKKYGRYCYSIAYNILCSREDAEECINDAYLRAWNSIPPARPDNFKAYLARIVRNLSLDRYFASNAKKRAGDVSAFDEISECLADASSSDVSDEIALNGAVNSFLGTLTRESRVIFLQRYWYFQKISDIARTLNVSESKVKVTLNRTRKKFREYLLKEGIKL